MGELEQYEISWKIKVVQADEESLQARGDRNQNDPIFSYT